MNPLHFILKPYYYLRAVLAYERAVGKAEEVHAATGERIYIIKGAGRKLLLTDRDNFRRLKRGGFLSRKATIKDLEQHCFYCTSYRNGKDAMPSEVVQIKRRQCIRWMQGLPSAVYVK